MGATADEMLRLREYLRAGRELNAWITGAKAFALLSGAVNSGVIDSLRYKSTAQEIAEATGVHRDRVVDLCVALELHGIVRRDGDRYELTPRYALLAAPSAAIPLPTVLRYATVMTRALEASSPSDVAYTATASEDILALAEGSGISALSSSPHVGQETSVKVMPEVEALWRAGARHLEVGCGVGNSLLGTVITYPKVTAIGIEIDESTAGEARRRARVLGVDDRVEVRTMDACCLEDDGIFDTIQWSQLFFPTPTRLVVLRAMHRALRPGGYLFMPSYGSAVRDERPSRSTMLRIGLRAMVSGGASFLGYFSYVLGDTPQRRRAERRSASLTRLLFARWGVPTRSVGELAAEVTEGGFVVIRAEPIPASQLSLSRGLLLACRDVA
jgi:SAM-dependent methyltransferase